MHEQHEQACWWPCVGDAQPNAIHVHEAQFHGWIYPQRHFQCIRAHLALMSGDHTVGCAKRSKPFLVAVKALLQKP